MDEENTTCDAIYNSKWQGNISFSEHLEKLNKVRESLYSQNGWSSTNVNQTSKWVVDMENNSVKDNICKFTNNETGTIFEWLFLLETF